MANVPWEDEARDQIQKALPGDFKIYLDASAETFPSGRIRPHQYVNLLTEIYHLGRRDRYSELFSHYREYADSTRPVQSNARLSTSPIRDHRNEQKSRPGQPPLLSFYDLFRASISSWQLEKTDHRLQPLPNLDCSPITKLIWDEAKEELWDGGAAHACAEHGLEKFLRIILAFMQRKTRALANPLHERAKCMFLTGPDSEFTPLGIAIRYRHVNCIAPLLDCKGVNEYIQEGNNVLSGRPSGIYLLHEVVRWIQEEVSFHKDHARKLSILQEFEPVLQQIIDANSQLLMKSNTEGISPFGYAKGLGEAQEARQSYRSIELENILKRSIFSQLTSPEDIKLALYGTSDKEIGLDLSDFNFVSHRFEDFVKELEVFDRRGLGQNWLFEDTLLYLNLPGLRDDCGTSAVSRLLDILHGKGVSSIINLKLPDSSGKYSTSFVMDLLSRFRIYRFDWVRLDVNLDCLWCGPPLLETYSLDSFRLYSHDNFEPTTTSLPPLSLPNYRQVQEFTLVLVGKPPDANAIFSDTPGAVNPSISVLTEPGELLPNEAARTARAHALTKFKNMLGDMRVVEGLGPGVKWNDFIMKPRVVESILNSKINPLRGDLRNCHQFLAELGRIPEAHVENQELRHCIQVLRTKPVKVAVIDNGVDFTRDSIYKNIVTGMSFVKAGGDTEMPYLPWFTAADPHGTQMAYLVTRMNPWCHLYPVRIGVLQNDIDVAAAVKAIDWAVAKCVDIISISWVVSKPNEQLRQAIRRAVEKNILVVCSTADVGSKPRSEMYPASYQEVIAVSASNALGYPRSESAHDVHIMLGGDQIEAHGPKFMRNCAAATISGSSVATALAAGLASLCLFLARMANRDGTGEKFKEWAMMLRVFRSMQSSIQDRVVTPAEIFGNDFSINTDFSLGKSPIPKGLKHFDFMEVHKSLSAYRLNQFEGDLPRRNLSKQREAVGQINNSRQARQ